MRKFTLISSVVLGALALVGCINERKVAKQTTISLTASVDATNPVWSGGDAIGLHFVAQQDAIANKNLKLDGSFTPDSATATFEGEITLAQGDYTIYGYYPYGAIGDATTHHSIAKIAIPNVQKPSATSFDAAADIMVMNPITHTHDGVTPISYNGLQFKRSLAILKVVLNSSELDGEALQSVSVTTNDPTAYFSGNGHFDLNTGNFIEFYDAASTMVKAEPTDNIYANGTDAVLICVPAMTIAAGTELTISGATENSTFTKTIVVSEQGINLTAGNVFTLEMNIDAEEDHMAYDETLNNEWQRTNVSGKVTIGKAEFAIKEIIGLANRYDFTFYDEASKDNIIHIVLPVSQIGSEMPFVRVDNTNNWTFEFIHSGDLYYGSGTSMGTAASTISEGKMIIIKDGTDITYKMAIKFTDGVILKAKFVGTAIDLDDVEIGKDVMPGANQYAYNGKLYNIGTPFYSPQKEMLDAVGIFYLPEVNGFDNRAQFNLPLTMIPLYDGIPIDLMTFNLWELGVFIDGVRTEFDPNGNIVSGTITLSVNEEARTMTVTAHALYKNDIHLRINYSGPIAGVHGATTLPSSVDELVGTWDVSEVISKTANAEHYINNSHTITITKIDDTTIEIDNFTNGYAIFGSEINGGGDKVRATVNSAMIMRIGKGVTFTPTWSSDENNTTYLIPMTNYTIHGKLTTDFKDQTFRKTSDGTIIMVMQNGISQLYDIGNPMLTYAVGDWLGSTFKKEWFYACCTIWTKRP